jgi:hypothetical protein
MRRRLYICTHTQLNIVRLILSVYDCSNNLTALRPNNTLIRIHVVIIIYVNSIRGTTTRALGNVLMYEVAAYGVSIVTFSLNWNQLFLSVVMIHSPITVIISGPVFTEALIHP